MGYRQRIHYTEADKALMRERRRRGNNEDVAPVIGLVALISYVQVV